MQLQTASEFHFGCFQLNFAWYTFVDICFIYKQSSQGQRKNTTLSAISLWWQTHVSTKKKMESSRITITVSALSTITLILVTEQIINRT